MQVILLEKIRNLGSIGENISVKSGYARNYLIPYGKAITATSANIEKFSKIRDELEKKAAYELQLANERAQKFENASVNISARATPEGKLFGSINTSAVANALINSGFDVKKSEISMPQGPIHNLGEYEITLILHSDVAIKVKIIVTATEE